MKLLWVPHMAWAVLDGQRERHLISRWPDEGDEIHVLTWRTLTGAGAYVRSLRAAAERHGAVTIHYVPRLPNLLSRVTGNYARGFWPNEKLFQAEVRRLVRELGIDLLLYGLSHKMVGLPPFDVPVARLFDYLDMCMYPDVEDAYIRNSDLVICTSTVLMDRVRERGGAATYIPNGVDPRRIAAGDRVATRRQLGIHDRTVVSLIGLTSSRTLFFVDALAEAARSVPNLVFLVVGGDVIGTKSILGPIRERCRELGVPIVTTGQIPSARIGDYFAATDVGLYPGDANSYFDAACPIKVLEYTAARKPVVATSLEELRRLALANVLLAPAEPKAYAAQIIRALKEDLPVADVGAFDWATLAGKFREACAQAVAVHTRAGDPRRVA